MNKDFGRAWAMGDGSDASLEQLRRKIAEKSRGKETCQKVQHLSNEIHKWTMGRNNVTLAQLKSALNNLGIPTCDEDLLAIFAALSDAGDGSIPIKDFCEAMLSKEVAACHLQNHGDFKVAAGGPTKERLASIDSLGTLARVVDYQEPRGQVLTKHPHGTKPYPGFVPSGHCAPTNTSGYLITDIKRHPAQERIAAHGQSYLTESQRQDFLQHDIVDAAIPAAKHEKQKRLSNSRLHNSSPILKTGDSSSSRDDARRVLREAWGDQYTPQPRTTKKLDAEIEASRPQDNGVAPWSELTSRRGRAERIAYLRDTLSTAAGGRGDARDVIGVLMATLTEEELAVWQSQLPTKPSCESSRKTQGTKVMVTFRDRPKCVVELEVDLGPELHNEDALKRQLRRQGVKNVVCCSPVSS